VVGRVTSGDDPAELVPVECGNLHPAIILEVNEGIVESLVGSHRCALRAPSRRASRLVLTLAFDVGAVCPFVRLNVFELSLRVANGVQLLARAAPMGRALALRHVSSSLRVL